MCERPLAHNRAFFIEQAGLVRCRAPVDAGEPAECLLSHGPVLSWPTSRHDACRNLYGRSRARLPTGHPSWPTCRGTGPKLVLVARVRNWSLPTGRLARSAYARTDRALPGYRVRNWSLPTGRLARSAYTRTDRALPGYRVRNWSLPTGRLARSAYTRTDRALPGYRCVIGRSRQA